MFINNKKYVKENNEEAITLISLIIIIVIVVILAITIIATINERDNLFSKTKEATEMYKNAQIYEKNGVSTYIDEAIITRENFKKSEIINKIAFNIKSDYANNSEIEITTNKNESVEIYYVIINNVIVASEFENNIIKFACLEPNKTYKIKCCIIDEQGNFLESETSNFKTNEEYYTGKFEIYSNNYIPSGGTIRALTYGNCKIKTNKIHLSVNVGNAGATRSAWISIDVYGYKDGQWIKLKNIGGTRPNYNGNATICNSDYEIAEDTYTDFAVNIYASDNEHYVNVKFTPYNIINEKIK